MNAQRIVLKTCREGKAMKRTANRFFISVAGMLLVLPSAGFSAPGTFADQPLFISQGVKHNVLLAIDDSGSMDFEVLFPNDDGSLYVDGTTGSFINADGSYRNGAGDNGKFTYLFPNGLNGTYDGKKLVSNHYAIPPILANAFVRSGRYNKAYYDPNQVYDPWPTYGGFTYGNITATAAPFDPLFPSFTLDLTQNVNTSSSTGWAFDIRDDDQVCDDSGAKCATGTKDYIYYPATYYVEDTTSTYTYTPTGTPPPGFFYSNESVVIETEAMSLSAPIVDITTPAILNTSLVSSSSGMNYIGPTGVTASTGSLPVTGNTYAEFTVPANGTYKFWLRRYFPSGSEDSYWFNIQGIPQASVTLVEPGNPWVTDAGESWSGWRDNHTTSTAWVWEQWASASLTAGVTYRFNLRYREPGAFLDQILVTKSAAVPTGAVTVSAPPTSTIVACSNTALRSPLTYELFRTSPGSFSGVDAIGPDGACLKKVEVKSGFSYTNSNGDTRTYAQEIQNFANWFTYYRKRHQAMRGGLATAFQGISGIRTGMFWINDRNDVTMWDMDNSTDVTSFLTAHYNHVKSGGTPLRTALKYAGDQLVRTGTGAPITAECQKNFTLLFTDGYNSNGASSVGNADGAEGSPYADSIDGSLGDVAMHYYKANPRASLPTGFVRVDKACGTGTAPAGTDCNTNLHMNTHTVGLGAKGTIYGVTHNNVQDAYTTSPTWPDVNGAYSSVQIDDLYHAAVNGRGDIFNADTPVELRNALSGALRDIVAKLGSASGVTFNTSTLKAGSLVFSARFNSAAWSGELSADNLDASNGNITTRAWDAHTLLDARNLAGNDRAIITKLTAGDGVPFRWGSLDATQQLDLNAGPNSTTDTLGSSRVDFLRGSRAGESTTFRTRSSRLGDIVQSSPVFVGPPSLRWPDAAPFGTDTVRYSSFKNDATYKGRDAMVYVGANDGMLHGFNATAGQTASGQEVLAYVPAAIYSNAQGQGLHYLTDPNYKHRYYVDLTPTVSDVYIKRTTAGTQAWRTVLVGGLRTGGRGIFALDISNPTEFSEANASDLVLWEFPSAQDPDLGLGLGYITSPPVVAMMNNGKWAAIFGNGYNSGGTTTTLFIVYLEEGVDGSWAQAGDFRKIELSGTGDGLSGPAVVDTNGDRVADRIYAGDLAGRMWAIDVSDTNPSQWGSAYKSGGSTPVPMYTALNGSSQVEPITAPPLIARNKYVTSDNSNAPNLMVYFGTGQYLVSGDLSDTKIQSFYGVWDDGKASSLTRSKLVSRSITQTSTVIVADDTSTPLVNEEVSVGTRTTAGADITWTGTAATKKNGWYMDFNVAADPGERVVLSPQIRGEIVFFNTLIPVASACADGGRGWLMSVDMDGTTPDVPIVDINNDGIVNSSDGTHSGTAITGGIPNKSSFLGDYQYTPTTSGDILKQKVDVGSDDPRLGRLGWHEITDQ